MVRVYTFTFVAKRQVAEDTFQVEFSTKLPFAFTPGQYVRMTLPQLSSDVPGGNTHDFSLIGMQGLPLSVVIKMPWENVFLLRSREVRLLV